ncbi:xanthine dehydrogenase molybdenum-binding subunit XdhA [Paradesulfitobacterium aromaticivorans]
MGYAVVGQRVPRVDAREKVSGRALYTGDMTLPHMLVGKVLRSPYAHAQIVRIDTTKARSLPGVKAVLTFEDVPKIPWNSAGFPPSPGAILMEDQYILTDKVRYVGDGLAAVAAVDEETADRALELIEVEYEVLPALMDVEAAMAEDAPLIHAAPKNVMAHMPIVIGDVDQGFADADMVFEDTYYVPKVYQVSMEPCGVAMAAPDMDGRVTIWTSTQMPHLVRGITAHALGLSTSQVRIIKPPVGGAFGSRLGVVNEPIAALLAIKARKPVMLKYSREESFLATESRHPITMILKTGIKKDGTFTARQMTAYLDGGAYATHTPSFAGPVAGWFLAMYKSPNIKVDNYSVYTNSTQCGAFRGYGNPQVVFAVESQVDDIAAALGLNPLEIRLKNHPCAGEVWNWSSWVIESCGLEEGIKRGSEAIGWEKKRNKRERVLTGAQANAGSFLEKEGEENVRGNDGSTASSTKKRGVGMAYMMHVSGARPMLHETSAAVVKINEDGKANLIYSNSDCGQGSGTALTQVAAEELGLNYEDVFITKTADTDVAGFDIGSHASRQAYSGGNAVKKAAAAAKEKLLAMASEILEVPAADLEVAEGMIRVRQEPEREISVAEVSHKAHFGSHGHQIIGAVSEESPGNPPVYAAQFVEVEVDTETGVIKVLKVVAAHDVGTAINPAVVEGQIEGAIQQGIGYALTEEYRYHPGTGKPLNPNFTDYKILTAVDMPEVETILIEASSESGPFGAKSVGESGLVATAAAIANAVYDAVGIRIKELPLTPEKVLAALEQKGN